jgi:hypothetical protein
MCYLCMFVGLCTDILFIYLYIYDILTTLSVSQTMPVVWNDSIISECLIGRDVGGSVFHLEALS